LPFCRNEHRPRDDDGVVDATADDEQQLVILTTMFRPREQPQWHHYVLLHLREETPHAFLTS
jgi:hypothetical protein